MKTLGRSTKWLLFALIGALLPTPASAQHFFFRWWLRPPVEAVAENTVFDPVSVTHASFAKYTVTSGRITDRTRTDLQNTETTATVSAAGDEITFSDPNPIVLTDGTTTVTVTLDPASLWQFYFGTYFFGAGSATIDDGTTQQTIDDVSVYGQIHTVNGEYRLRANVYGTIYTPTTTTATNSRRVRPSFVLQLLYFNLSGTAAVPTTTPETTSTPTKPTS